VQLHHENAVRTKSNEIITGKNFTSTIGLKSAKMARRSSRSRSQSRKQAIYGCAPITKRGNVARVPFRSRNEKSNSKENRPTNQFTSIIFDYFLLDKLNCSILSASFEFGILNNGTTYHEHSWWLLFWS
jgi:hypothetical protein